MDRDKVLNGADNFLKNIGVQTDYITIPGVLIPNQIPNAEEDILLRAIEELLTELHLVETPNKKIHTQGGHWRRVKLTAKAYEMVKARQSIRTCLTDEEKAYNRFRSIYEILSEAPDNSLSIKSLNQKMQASYSSVHTFASDIRHFHQLGWLSVSRPKDAPRRIVLKHSARIYYTHFHAGLGYLKDRPYDPSRRLKSNKEKLKAGLTWKRRYHKYREKRKREKDIHRLISPDSPYGLWETIWYFLTNREQKNKGFDKNTRKSLTKEERKELQRATLESIIEALKALVLIFALLIAGIVVIYMLFLIMGVL